MAGLVPFAIGKIHGKEGDLARETEIVSVNNKNRLVAVVSNEYWAKFIVDACNDFKPKGF